MPVKRKIYRRTTKESKNSCNVTKSHLHLTRQKKVATRAKNYGKRDIYKSPFRSSGLSSKEKSYVISSLQNRTSRYNKLKVLADRAKRESKIFSIYGKCNAIRRSLLQRGWVEKIPPYRMNLSKIRNGVLNKSDSHSELERLMLSNLVEKCVPNFVWQETHHNYDTTIDMKKEYKTIVNKLQPVALWTTKQGLCTSLKTNYWFYIEDVAEVIYPRTYNSYDSGEVEEFVADYRITACTSLLQWVILMLAEEKVVFADKGTIPLSVINFALNRCKEYIFYKRNKDIDRPIKTVTAVQWNIFLKKYYRLINSCELFEVDKNSKVPEYFSIAKVLLQKMQKYRPQLSCEGFRNIWIMKPAHCSRGRGIRMASKLAVITDLLTKANAKYVVQKYIEKPLLIYETKFDIRQYYLVTRTYPLVIWMYRDCYLKFSSQKYNLNDYHESIHLTNNAVQRKYNNYAGRHLELPASNMWELDTYKIYLNKIGLDSVWEHIIYPGMKKSIIGIMLSCQDSLPFCKNRFELYGCDFLLDNEYTPWLIEINSCPDLSSTTDVTAKICPAVVDDVIKVILDYTEDSTASTGNFECIFNQPMTVPKFTSSTELSIRGRQLPHDYFLKDNLASKVSSDLFNLNDDSDDYECLNRTKLSLKDSIIVKNENRNNQDKNCYTKNSLQFNEIVESNENNFEVSSKALSLTTMNALLGDFNTKVTIESINGTEQQAKSNEKSTKYHLHREIQRKYVKPKDYILQVTPKIMSFINSKKEKYIANFQWPNI